MLQKTMNLRTLSTLHLGCLCSVAYQGQDSRTVHLGCQILPGCQMCQVVDLASTRPISGSIKVALSGLPQVSTPLHIPLSLAQMCPGVYPNLPCGSKLRKGKGSRWVKKLTQYHRTSHGEMLRFSRPLFENHDAIHDFWEFGAIVTKVT